MKTFKQFLEARELHIPNSTVKTSPLGWGEFFGGKPITTLNITGYPVILIDFNRFTDRESNVRYDGKFMGRVFTKKKGRKIHYSGTQVGKLINVMLLYNRNDRSGPMVEITENHIRSGDVQLYEKERR